MRKAQSKLQKIQDVKTRDQKEDYEFLRHKVTQVVGDEAAADEVLKEAIIQNVKENCQDGINVFVGDEKADDATIKMNNSYLLWYSFLRYSFITRVFKHFINTLDDILRYYFFNLHLPHKNLLSI